MPYIGNNHIAGDHTNNFKVLDDISSFTATFDGSASSVVDTTNNTIRVVEHRFIQGQRVTYTNGSGGNIGGLATGTAYFVIFDSASTIKLATSASNAASSTAINLSAVGTGSSHTLNAAFDGVNTKFKITYNSGTGARFNNATQLNIAINNVLQKPNVNSTTFTEGFAIEDNHKIVFKIAPTSEDIFWGSIIANTLTTFDISDHKIDTFTGDGSTTEFTLSHTPANNESLMVTINGVLQHPSNASTARAYTLIASIIQFTAAPGVGDEIQVRHLGFAGATTADVSGFYGRTGNVALTANDHITTGDITARNFKATGISTFSGNVSIGGTLTYEDVTNIDSVGLVTARDGIFLPDSKKAMFGNTAADPDLEIYHGGTASYISHTGTGNLYIHSNTIALRKQNQQAYFVGVNGQSKLYEGGSERLVTTDKGITVGTGVTIETNGNSNFVGVSSLGTGATGAVYLYNPDADALSGTTNDIYGWKAKTYTSGLQVNSTLYLSRSGVHGLSLNYNNATGGYINQSVGFLNISCPGGLPIYLNAYQHVLQDPGGKKRIIINNSSDQAVHLYHNNVLKFSTADSGINVVGTTTSTQLAVTGISTFTGNIDANGDLDVDGHTNLDNVSIAGVTTITGSGNALEIVGGVVRSRGTASARFVVNNGSAEGYFGWSSGVLTVGQAAATLSLEATGSNHIQLKTNGDERLRIASGGSIQITPEGSTSNPYMLIDTSGDSVRFSAKKASGNNEFRFLTQSSGTVAERLRIDTNGKLTLSNSEGIQLSAKTSSLYTSDGSISYFATNNAVYINGAGASGWMRLSAAGTANNRTAINIYGHSYATADQIDFRTNSTERLNISSTGNLTIGTAAAAGGKLYFQSTSGAAQYIASGGTNNQDLIIGSSAGEFIHITSGGHTLFGASSKNDTRNAKGITLKGNSGGSGISFETLGSNGSRNWRIRPDDLVDWGTLEFSVSPTANSTTDWPDSLDDTVLTLKPDKNVLVNNGSIEANDNTLSAISKTASSDTYEDIFVYDTRKDSDGGAWRHRTTNTSWYNETLNTSIRGARREFPQVAIIAVGVSFIHILDADDPDMPMWMEFPASSGGARNVMYGPGNPRTVYMLNGILCTGSQAANYWPVLIDFIRDDILGLRSATGHNHYNGRQGNISLRNSATSDNGVWWPDTITGGASSAGRISKRWWFDGVLVNKYVTSVVMSVRPEAPIDKTTGMQIPTIYLGTRGGVSIIHSNVGDTGTSYSSAFYNIVSNNGPYSGVGDITITDDGYLWTLHDFYNYNSDGGYNYYRDSSAIDLKRLDNQMNNLTTSPSSDTVSSLNNQAGSGAEKGREYYWPSTGAESGTHKIGYNNTWAANIVERDAWGCPLGIAFVKRSIYTYDHKENGNFLVRSHQNRGLVAMITKDYNTGWHMTGNVISSCYIADGLTSSIPAGASEMLDRGHHARQLDVVGGLTRAKCATGSDLSCVSGFSGSNYARITNASLNAGNPINITMMGWIKVTDLGGYSYLCSISNGSDAMGIAIHNSNSSNGGKAYFYDSQHGVLLGDKGVNDGEWHHICGVFSCSSNRKILYIDGQRQDNITTPSNKNYSDLDTIAVGHYCGGSGTDVDHSCRGSLALVKLGLTDLTDQQIKRIYEDEKKLLQPNAKAFLYGSSNSITAIGYDEKKDIYHVGTSSGRSDFSGLSRINNTTTAVTTAISAYDGLIAEQ